MNLGNLAVALLLSASLSAQADTIVPQDGRGSVQSVSLVPPDDEPDLDVERARELTAAGLPLPATYLLSRALVRDPDSVPALTALAEALLGLGDALSAQVAARRAATLAPSAPGPQALLGDALTALDDAAAAEVAYRKALELQPNPALQEKLSQLAKRPGVPRARLRIRYDGRMKESLGAAVLEVVDRTYSEYAERLGFGPDAPITIVLQMGTKLNAAGVPGWAAGVNDGAIRVPAQGLEEPVPSLITLLRHELAHSFIAARTGDNCPTWLHEGIAQWLEGGDPAREDPGLALAAREGKLIPLLSLEAPFRKLSEARAALAYAQSLSVVAHLLRHHGEHGIVELLSALAGRLPAEQDLPAALGLSYQELRARWEAELRLGDASQP